MANASEPFSDTYTWVEDLRMFFFIWYNRLFFAKSLAAADPSLPVLKVWRQCSLQTIVSNKIL